MSAIAPRPRADYDDPRSLKSIDDLDAPICRIASRMDAAHYQLLLLVREFDDRLGWAKWSYQSCAEWLAWRCAISLSAAREKVRTAHALRELPEISAAFERGRLSYSKVRALTRAADAQNEDSLLAYALNASAAQVEERCRQMRNVSPESVDEAKRVWERRSLSVWRNPEAGTMTISVEVPLEAGEVIIKALDRAVEAGEAAAGPEFPEASWQTQQADALVAVARAYLAGATEAPAGVGQADSAMDDEAPADAAARDEVGTNGRSAARGYATADHYQVVVHVDQSALRGGTGRADLPIETIKRLTCDGSLIAVMEDERGKPLSVGRKQRTVPRSIKRALWSRDRGCSFPACHRRRFVDAHHIRHWIEGGETSVENTTLLCSHHHRLLHEGGYRIRRDHEGEIYFERADGRVIPRCGYRADDVRPDPVYLENTSAEGWLAAIVNRRRVAAEVREEPTVVLDRR